MLVEALEKAGDRPHLRGGLLRALGMLAANRADTLDVLAKYMHDEHWYVRSCVARGLASALFKHPHAAGPLGELLRDGDLFVRERAAQGMRGAARAAEGQQVICAALGDGDPLVRALAARAVHGGVDEEASLLADVEAALARESHPGARRELRKAILRLR